MPLVLGSRSTDTLSGTGPLPLTAGSFLPVAPARHGVVGFAEISPLQPFQGEVTALHFVPGPRSNWFTDDSLNSLTQLPWTVTPASNRVGLRLEYLSAHTDAVLQRASASPAELASEGMVKGAIQVPPSGVPVLFLADHPVTGGYPVIGVVVGADLDKAAQLAPGAQVRFVRAC